MKWIEVAGREIGPDRPCFIIAEAGVNHNGDVDLAKRLVDAAQNAGADAVKFQTWITEKLVAPDAPMAEYQKQNLGTAQTQFEMLKSLELSQQQFREIKAHADNRGILFFSTPDEEDSCDFLIELGVPLLKIGSAEVTNLPYLRHVAMKRKPVILSTGMSTLSEVEAAVRVFESAGNSQLILLHCVSSYPADPADCNLRAVETMSQAFDCPTGFSDHTLGVHVAVAAVARGSCVIEKHLTLDQSLPGPDHRASLEPQEFAAMVSAIRSVESALGNGVKRPTAAELATKKVVQKTIVARRDIKAGGTVNEADVSLRRTSGGLEAAYLPFVLGRRADCDVQSNRPITFDMLR
jgi:N,N'-diacetyllegionaminate synthase